VAKNAIVESNGIIYFAAMDSPYAYETATGHITNIAERGGKGGIRQEWQAFTEAERIAAVAGYDRNRNCVLFHVGSQNYIFWIDTGSWVNFTGISTPLWLFTGVDGEMIVLADQATDTIANVFGGTPDVSTRMRWQTGVIEGPLRTKRIRIPFKGTDLMEVDFYDAVDSTSTGRIPRRTLQREALTTKKGTEASGSFSRLQVRVQSVNSTNSDNEMERIEIDADGITKK